MNYMTLIYDYYNVLIRIEERNSLKEAEKAGEFYTHQNGWYMVTKPENEDERQMYYAMINM